MHDHESVESCRDIVEHDARSLRKSLQLPDRRRLDDIEGSKKYKAGEKSFPRQGDGNQGDELSGDLIDDHELRILGGVGAGDLGGGRECR